MRLDFDSKIKEEEGWANIFELTRVLISPEEAKKQNDNIIKGSSISHPGVKVFVCTQPLKHFSISLALQGLGMSFSFGFPCLKQRDANVSSVYSLARFGHQEGDVKGIFDWANGTCIQ